MSWIDISQPLSPGLVVWPGDQPFVSTQTASLLSGDVCNVGSVHFSLHAGSHADAPLHYRAGGSDIAGCDVGIFMGPAQVIEVKDRRSLSIDQLNALEAGVARLLVKTGTGVEAGWHEEFSYIEEDAARELVRRGVVLVGMDTPSVDPAQSSGWPAHHLFAEAGVVVLENLRLAEVRPGWYDLVALPLKLCGLEASPVRAVVRPLSRRKL